MVRGGVRFQPASRKPSSPKAPVLKPSKLPPGWVEARVYLPVGQRQFLVTMAERRKVSFSTYCRKVLLSADHGKIVRGEDELWEGTS